MLLRHTVCPKRMNSTTHLCADCRFFACRQIWGMRFPSIPRMRLHSNPQWPSRWERQWRAMLNRSFPAFKSKDASKVIHSTDDT